ncbi:MAG: glycosyltransferase family 4 protein [Clostridia bacterium]|nr:glycosyltransferase family 4 protein [Clostridia bacterium]
MKKVLIVASVISFIEWFQKENIDFLVDDMGCEVHVACNCDYMEDTSEARTREYMDRVNAKGVVFHNVEFARSPFKKENITAYRQLKALIDDGKYDLIHCHTPMASILARLAARKARKGGTTVVYTCHGYHFFTGAPIKNWIMFYPVEKICARMTDVLININGEDYERAKKKMHAGRIEYIPGVGINVEKFAGTVIDRAEKRRELDIPEESFLVFSVGELNINKNHSTIIKAIASMQDKNVHYAVAGKGDYHDELVKLAESLGISDRVHLLGFRRDMAELYHVGDVFAFPSFREGLPASVMEAMASGMPVVASKIRGNSDLVQKEKGGYLCAPDSVDDFAKNIDKLRADADLRAEMGAFNVKYIEGFSDKVVMEKSCALYRELLGE